MAASTRLATPSGSPANGGGLSPARLSGWAKPRLTHTLTSPPAPERRGLEPGRHVGVDEARLDAHRDEPLRPVPVIEGFQVVRQARLGAAIQPDGLSPPVSGHRGEDAEGAAPAREQPLAQRLAQEHR